MSPFIPCPPTLKFEQFLLGRLEDKEYESLEVHLASCTHCQQLLTTTVADDELVQTLRKISNSSSAEKSTRLADAPDELVDLLVPHFKRIANSLDETALFASRPARRAGSKLQETSTSDTAESQRIGRYEIQGVLGQGGMGVVLQAFDPLLRRTVAIKVIQSKLLADKGMASRLVREAQAAAAVEHDNIVPVYSVEIHEDAPCIIMPLLRGITLKQRLDETTGPLPLAEILRIAREAASGLAAAHAGGLIHCDIKPANLWLEEPLGRVKVLDFGLAFVSGDLESGSEGIAR